MQITHAYAFIGGAVVSRLVGTLPSLIISGLVIYIVEPSLFSRDNVIYIKDTAMSFIK